LDSYIKSKGYLNEFFFWNLPEFVFDDEMKILLGQYYDNPKKYAFKFQNRLLIKKANMFKSFSDNLISEGIRYKNVVLIDRSFEVDKDVFFRIHHDEGNISKDMVDKYELLHKKLMQSIYANFQNEYLLEFNNIYLDTPPSVCSARIKSRGRCNEPEQIKLDYLKLVEKYHLELNAKRDKKTYVIDGTEQQNIQMKSIYSLILQKTQNK